MLKIHDYESISPRVNRFLWITDRVGHWLVPWGRRGSPRKERTQIKELLLLRCDGIGDLICSIPAIRKVRKVYPQASVTLMVGPWNSAVAAMIPEVDRVIEHAPWGYRKLRADKVAGGVRVDIHQARMMRREGFDLAIDLRSDLLSLLPLLFWKIPCRVGRATRGGGFCLTQTMPAVPKTFHEIERTLAVVPGDNQQEFRRLPYLEMSEQAKLVVTDLLGRYGATPEQTILLCPGAQWKWRAWPQYHYVALASMLHEQGFRVGLVGSAKEKALAESICRDSDGEPMNLAGKMGLAELAAAFRACAGFVSAESGPALIASAVEATGVVIFGPGIPDNFGPFSDSVTWIQHECSCRPCYQRGDCRFPDQWCMEKVTPEQAFEALLRQCRRRCR